MFIILGGLIVAQSNLEAAKEERTTTPDQLNPVSTYRIYWEGSSNHVTNNSDYPITLLFRIKNRTFNHCLWNCRNEDALPVRVNQEYLKFSRFGVNTKINTNINSKLRYRARHT